MSPLRLWLAESVTDGDWLEVTDKLGDCDELEDRVWLPLWAWLGDHDWLIDWLTVDVECCDGLRLGDAVALWDALDI